MSGHPAGALAAERKRIRRRRPLDHMRHFVCTILFALLLACAPAVPGTWQALAPDEGADPVVPRAYVVPERGHRLVRSLGEWQHLERRYRRPDSWEAGPWVPPVDFARDQLLVVAMEGSGCGPVSIIDSLETRGNRLRVYINVGQLGPCQSYFEYMMVQPVPRRIQRVEVVYIELQYSIGLEQELPL